MLQQVVDGFDAWPIDRRVIAAQQLFCRIDDIEVGRIDGIAGELSRYAFEVYDARKAAGGKPAAAVEAWRDDAAAPAAIPSRALPSIASSQIRGPS